MGSFLHDEGAAACSAQAAWGRQAARMRSQKRGFDTTSNLGIESFGMCFLTINI